MKASSNELVIDIGITDEYEFGQAGSIIFNIPHYKVRVNLERPASLNISPTFTWDIKGPGEKKKKTIGVYYHLPVKEGEE